MDPNQGLLTLVHAMAHKQLSIFLARAGSDEERHALLLTMKPRDEDFEKVFLPPLLEPARTLYAQLWSKPPPLVGKPEQNQVVIHTATSEDFADWTRRGQEFPGGYQKLGPHVKPGLVWVAWKFVVDGDTVGLSFDGGVWLADRLVWFPQPWRLVPMGPVAPAAPSSTLLN